jgi:broad specificity phosphatase PhoE
MSKEVIIIRHGRSTHNTHQSDDGNAPLTEWGIRQAKKVGQFLVAHLKLVDFDFFSSPFERCLQTMECIRQPLHEWGYKNQEYIRMPQVMSGLREYLNHFGEPVTLNLNKTKEKFPVGNYHYFSHPEYTITYEPEWNEVFYNRIDRVYRDLPEKSLVVTHGLPAMLLRQIASNGPRSIPIWDYSIDNCSITYIVDGKIIWNGRNLHTEIDEDTYAHKRKYDGIEVPALVK